MEKSREPYIQIISCLVLASALMAFYALAYQYHFYWIEQNQTFLYDRAWIATYLGRPAWLACLAGEFLSQFFYYRLAGPAILSVIITFTVWTAYRCVRSMLPVTVAVLSALVVAVWCIGSSFASTYTLSQTLSIAGGLASFMLIRKTGLWGIVFVPLLYWLLGFGTLCTCACYLLLLISSPSAVAAICAVSALALMLMAPLCLKDHYSLTYSSALIYPPVSKPVWPEMAFEQTLAVENEYYFGNYDKAVRLALDKNPQNLVTAFYFYLAQAKRDSLPDHLLTYGIKDLGTLNQIGEETPKPIINMMNDLYYELGDMTYTERAAMMRNVFSPQNRNVRMVKRLAEANLVSGDTIAAIKYLRILSRTHAYRRWAESRMPGKMNEAVKHDIERRQCLTNSKDTLRLGDNCRTILTQLLDSNPDNILALDYLLCTDLLLKDMDLFKADYDRYCTSRGKHRMKSLYQQAMIIYLTGTGAPAEDWEKYIQMPGELQRFRDYNRHRGSTDYSDTYWYYFDTH